MSQDEDRGLLSKVARLMRSPLGWSDLDQPSADDARYSKQMLKDMIERRRRNDFVRRREFDALRRLRAQLGAQASQLRGSQSALPSSQQRMEQQRAHTVNKKIDEIEAQMSQQWWKTRHGEVEARDNPNTDFSPSFSVLSPEPPPMPLRPASPPADRARAGGKPASAASPHAPRPLTPPAAVPSLEPATPARDSLVSDSFTHSKLNAVQVAEFTHDPLLEEAAIRFANGDDEGADAALQEALRNPETAPGGNEALWMALFDLYRATGQYERFESAALDYANRTGHSAPVWFSIPAKLRQNQAVPSELPPEVKPTWEAPALIDEQAVSQLVQALDTTPQPWVIAWGAVHTIEPNALGALMRVFSNWTNQSVRLRFQGGSALLNQLTAHTVQGDRHTDTRWWQLRMELLRIMQRPDEFEVAALDYCVTYEVSPPSWDSALCDFKSLDSTLHTGHLSSPPTIIKDSGHEAVSTQPLSDFIDTEAPGDSPATTNPSHISVVDLSGVIRGDAVEMLDALNSQLGDSRTIVVLCERLIRLDFLAAGTLLNWTSSRQAEGRQVHFKDLHRLVAAFFHVIGISEHAHVIVAKD